MRAGSEIFHTLRAALKAAGHNTNVGDEGGFAPNLPSAEAALDLIVAAIEKAGYRTGDDVMLALDPAASEFFSDGAYRYEGEGKTRSIEQQVEYLAALVAALSDRVDRRRHGRGRPGRLEAPDAENRRAAASSSATTFSSPTSRGSSRGSRTASPIPILIKVNQIGTLTETLAAVEMAHKAGYTAVMSHRSGETEDSTIADLAVATNCGQIKTGSLARCRPHREIQSAAADRGGTRPAGGVPGARGVQGAGLAARVLRRPRRRPLRPL